MRNILYILLSASDALVGEFGGALSNGAEGVGNISKAMSEYGPVVVISSVFILIFIGLSLLILTNNAKMMKHMMDQNKSTEEANETIVSKLVQTALDSYISSTSQHQTTSINSSVEDVLKHSLKPIEEALIELKGINSKKNEEPNDGEDDYHKDLIGAYMDINMYLKDATRSAIDSIDCDRVAIYIFHNGNESIHGLPFFKLSCIHEWTRKGVKTLRGRNHVDIPLHIFEDFIEVLYTDGYYKTNDIQKAIEENPSLADFTAYSNVKAFYMVGIYDNNMKLVGFVVSEFERSDSFDINPERDILIGDTLRIMCQKVSPILAERYTHRCKK